jgi:pseudouridylate synthase I
MWAPNFTAGKDKYPPKGWSCAPCNVSWKPWLAALPGKKVHIHASGRTDTGVHAEAQVAHMDVPLNRANVNWQRFFNTQLPGDVAIAKVEPVPQTFHAQYSALSKLYSYSLWLKPDYTPPRLKDFVWSCGPLNLEAMQKAAKHFVGRIDCASFRNVGVEYRTTIRTIELVKMDPPDPANPYLFVWHFQADGFLKQMVRNMMGLLAEVGRGRFTPDQVADVIAACNRRASAATAPPGGLCLSRVFYPEDNGV